MNDNVECKWVDGMAFEADIEGHRLVMDAGEAVGGRNYGPRPKPLTLAALAGCSGMDIISILRKMRSEPAYFNISVKGDVAEEHPKSYEKIHITYTLRGEDVEYEKVKKAVELTHERYCSVNAMLGKTVKITFDIIIEE